MNWQDRACIVAALADSFNKRQAWCDEERLQKAVYFLQAVSGVPSEYQFILDMDGPFSFELRDDLALFRSRNVLRLEAQPAPYGPSYAVTSTGKALECSLKTSDAVIQYVAGKLAGLGAVGMERFSTALYVTCSLEPNTEPEHRVKRFMDLKPEIQQDVARAAIAAADEAVKEKAGA